MAACEIAMTCGPMLRNYYFEASGKALMLHFLSMIILPLALTFRLMLDEHIFQRKFQKLKDDVLRSQGLILERLREVESHVGRRDDTLSVVTDFMEHIQRSSEWDDFLKRTSEK